MELGPDGSVLVPSFPVAPAQNASQLNPKIGVDHFENISISWIDYGSGFPLLTYARRPAGQSFGAPVTVDSSSLAFSNSHSMAVDVDGYPHLAWANSNPAAANGPGLYYATTADFANFQSSVTLITAGQVEDPVIRVDLLKKVYFSWDDESALYFEKWDPSGGGPGTPVMLGAGTGGEMEIGLDGRTYLLFATGSSGNYSTLFFEGE
jgi:hypothetical protein